MRPVDLTVDRVGVVVALSLEARSLRLAAGGVGGDTVIAICGPGPQRATTAAVHLLRGGATCLVNIGVAGALVPWLRPGDLLLPDAVLDRVGCDALVPDGALRGRMMDALRAAMPVHGGALWTSAEAVRSMAAKRALASRAACLAVDMEAAAVARAAREAGVPFVAVKAIGDPVERCVPAGAPLLLTPNGRVSLRALIAFAVRGPSAWRALAAARRDFSAARRALASAAPAIRPALARP